VEQYRVLVFRDLSTLICTHKTPIRQPLGWEGNKLKKRNSGFLENDRNLFTFFDYDYPPLKGEFGRTAG
jgi:hypothetical protein